ncbi:MAG: phosphate ABC transporter permease PstA [Thermoguttaceae bacterium]
MKRAAEGAAGPAAYFLRSGGGRGAAGTPFSSLEGALAALGRQGAALMADCPAPATPSPLEIVCRSNAVPHRAAANPRYHFYVNARAAGAPAGTAGRGGDGSELAPWWGLETAVEQLLQLHRSGQIDLGAGHFLRLSHREVFTPTSLERRKRIKENVARAVFLAMTLALVLPMLAIFAYLIARAWPALSFSFLLENPRNNMTAGGIWAPLVGTFFLVFLSLAVAAPVGILAGVYLNEYARDNWLTRTINLGVVNLAGVPSIVHGLFGVGAFVHFARMGCSLLAASCTVAVMTLPVIITSTREALASVPRSFREACWNLGASRWQTIRTIVLPNSISGILTGVILQVSRAAGETAPILFTGAMLFTFVPDHGWRAFFPYGLRDSFMALSMHLFTLSKESNNVSEGIQYGTAAVLIGLVLAFNSLSIALRVYLRVRKKW